MKNTMIKAAAAVPALRVADPAYNTDEIIRIMNEYSDCGLIVFPELSITAYTCGDLFGQKALLDEAEDQLFRIAKETEKLPGVCAVVGMPLRYNNELYNCAVFLNEGQIKAAVPKIYIPNYSEFYETRWFSSGRKIKGRTLNIKGIEIPFGWDIIGFSAESGAKIAAEICEDLWVPDTPGTHACSAGANIVVNPSASDEVIGKQDYRRTMVASKSASCYCDYIYASAGVCESSTDLVFGGHTLIAENGKILSDSIFDTPTYVKTAVLDLETCMYNRTHQNTFINAEVNDYRFVSLNVQALGSYEINTTALKELLIKENYPIPRNAFVPADDQERGRRCRRILQIQAHGLATRVRATNIKTLVIGISGGLDSTLALIVCHEAKKIVPDIRIIAYTMPNEGNTTSLTYNNAWNLMKALADDIREVPIGKSVKSHLEDIGHGTDYQGEGDITYENAQARMRTYILMDAANMENGLVVGTGDLSELALGWCTYNGDHMSMYGVNASVPKTLVKYICRSYAYTCNDDNLKGILLSIVDTPISPELTPNKDGQIAQKTEEKIGKYDLNDFFLFYMMRYGFEPEKIIAFASIAFAEVKFETIREALISFYSRFFHQQFKRSCLPDGPKVGSVTLSPRGDWRMPSDASVALWLEKTKKAS